MMKDIRDERFFGSQFYLGTARCAPTENRDDMPFSTSSSFPGLTGESSYRIISFYRILLSDMKPIFTIMFILSMIFAAPSNLLAEDRPAWWPQLVNEAQRDGYSLLTLEELKKLYESKEPFLILDTRTEYEYNDEHLPDALNMDFDPGDKLQLKQEKKSAFLKILGPDKNRKIIIYCRGFR